MQVYNYLQLFVFCMSLLFFVLIFSAFQASLAFTEYTSFHFQSIRFLATSFYIITLVVTLEIAIYKFDLLVNLILCVCHFLDVEYSLYLFLPSLLSYCFHANSTYVLNTPRHYYFCFLIRQCGCRFTHTFILPRVLHPLSALHCFLLELFFLYPKISIWYFILMVLPTMNYLKMFLLCLHSEGYCVWV